MNFTTGQTVRNMAIAPVGADGIIDLWNTGSGSTDLVVDAFGFYQND